MAAHSLDDKLVVIVGETGSGKSALAIELAEKFNGEIICADSRTVYKGMDIGTAKPSPDDRSRIPHHLLDIVEPDQPFTAADFQRLANEAIDAIHKRGRLPIMVGGSGLYIDAVLYDYGFSAEDAARDRTNPRHLSPDAPRPHKHLREQTLVLGLRQPRETLEKRLRKRVDAMVEDGLTKETEALGKRFGWSSETLQTPGYKAFRKYLDGTVSLEEAKQEFVRSDLQLAKRQRTWFKRNKSIQWLDDPRYAVDVVTTFLNKTTI